MKKQRYCPFCEKTTEWTDDEQIFGEHDGCRGGLGIPVIIGACVLAVSALSFDKKDYQTKEIEECKCSKCHHTMEEAEQYQEQKRNVLKEEIRKITENIAELKLQKGHIWEAKQNCTDNTKLCELENKDKDIFVRIGQLKEKKNNLEEELYSIHYIKR